MKVSRSGLRYQITGPGTSDFGVVLVHGWACRHLDYDGVVRQLVVEHHVDYRVVAVDLPGHGNTPKEVLPEPSMSHFAQLVLDLSDELHFKRIVAVGHSMGTRIAAETLRLSLDSRLSPGVIGVIFVDGSTYRLRSKLFAWDQGHSSGAVVSGEAKAAAKAQAFENMFSAATPQDFRTSTLQHLATIDQDHSQKVRDAQLAFDTDGFEAALQRIGKTGTPFLNLPSSNTDSGRVPIARADQRTKYMDWIKEHVPQVQEMVVLGSNHFPHVDRPEVIAKAIDAFVRQIRT